MDEKKINLKIIWAVFMVVVYLGMSFLLIFTNLFKENMSFIMRMVFGTLFFCYTLFRGYRLIRFGK